MIKSKLEVSTWPTTSYNGTLRQLLGASGMAGAELWFGRESERFSVQIWHDPLIYRCGENVHAHECIANKQKISSDNWCFPLGCLVTVWVSTQ